MSLLGIILVVILVLILLGGVGGPYIGAPWPAHYGVGYPGISVVGILLIIVLVLALTGRL